MIQSLQHKWRIESEQGQILQEDLNMGSVDEAENYCRRYVSSFMDWSYEVVPLPPKQEKPSK